MKLDWTPLSLADRDTIFDYVEADNPRAAMAIDQQIEDKADQLLTFPESGRPGRRHATRELVVTGLPYILIYEVVGELVSILRVLHTAQQWPENLTH